MGGDEYTARMDQQLPEATILLFRRLAHAKVRCTCHPTFNIRVACVFLVHAWRNALQSVWIDSSSIIRC